MDKINIAYVGTFKNTEKLSMRQINDIKINKNGQKNEWKVFEEWVIFLLIDQLMIMQKKFGIFNQFKYINLKLKNKIFKKYKIKMN